VNPEDFDVVVIGCGPAGEKGAAQAAYFGKKVAVVERAPQPGGACANTGTLPSKTLRETALHLSGMDAHGLGEMRSALDRALAARQLVDRKTFVAQAEQARIRRNVERHKITYVQGTAELADDHTVVVRDASGAEVRRLRGAFILVATGSSPHRPPEVPFDDRRIWDSDTVLTMTEVPASLIVVGAGVIGSEYASIFASLGTEVHLLDGRDRLLPFLDGEIDQVLADEMARIGVRFHFKANIKSYEAAPDRVAAVLDTGDRIEAKALLYAAGRNGNTKGMKLESVGVVPDKRGQLKVNENYQTNVPHIYAAGDVIGFPALASTSADQGRLAMCHALGLTYRKRLAEHLPMGIYTIPEVSAVGETEEQARTRGIDVEVGRFRFADNPRAQIMGQTAGLLKLVFEAATLKLLGVHIVCERASEIVTPGLVALRLGAAIDFFIETVFNYPTLSEAYKYAAYDGLGRLAARGRETGKALH
jgi:NAD(P) transhydrogenase